MSVRGNCSAVLVCVLVMRHWRLKVAIIAPASWTNKGCEQVHTQFVLEKLVWHCVGVNLQVIHLHIFSLSLHNCFFVCGALHFYNKSFKYIFQSFVPQSSILYVTFPHSAVGCLGSTVINRNKEVGREVDICRGAVTIGPRKQTWSFFSSCLELACWLIMWHCPPTNIDSDRSCFLHFTWLAFALGTFIKQILSFTFSSHPLEQTTST